MRGLGGSHDRSRDARLSEVPGARDLRSGYDAAALRRTDRPRRKHAALPGIYPDYSSPIIRNGSESRELVMARWGMPTPPQCLVGKRTDPGVTNIRRVSSSHWRPWLGTEHRCLIPLTSFADKAGRIHQRNKRGISAAWAIANGFGCD